MLNETSFHWIANKCRLTALRGCGWQCAAASDLLPPQANLLFELLDLTVTVSLLVALLLLMAQVVLHQLDSGNEGLGNAEMGVLLRMAEKHGWEQCWGAFKLCTGMKPSWPSPGLRSCQSPALTGSWWGSGLLTASWTFHPTSRCTGSRLRDHNTNTQRWLSHHFTLVLRTRLRAKILTRLHVEGTGGTAIAALGWERAVVHHAFISCQFYLTNRITITEINAFKFLFFWQYPHYYTKQSKRCSYLTASLLIKLYKC